MNKWIGAERSALVKTMGEPQVIVPVAEGGEVMTYIESYAGVGNSNVTVSTSFTIGRDGKVVSWRRA